MTDAAPDVTIYVISKEEAFKFWLTLKEDAREITPENARKLWEKMRSAPALAANYYSTGTDIITLEKIVGDFGTMFGRVYLKEYGGKTHIILKGLPGLRRILTGTKYSVANPKVISMGLGTRGALNSIKEGGILTAVLVTAFDVVDYFFSDKETLSELVGQIASDVTKVAITAGVSAASVALLSGTIVTSFALGPLLVAVVVGVGVGFALNAIDEHFKLTDKLKSMIAAAARDIKDEAQAASDEIRRLPSEARQARDNVVDRAYQGLIAFLGYVIREVEEQAANYVWKKVNNLRWYLLPQA